MRWGFLFAGVPLFSKAEPFPNIDRVSGLPKQTGKCSNQTECDKINYLCTSGKLRCVDGQLMQMR